MMIFKIEWMDIEIETASNLYRDAAAAAFENLPSEMVSRPWPPIAP